MQTYKGRYKVTKPEKYKGNHKEVVYRSGWERFAFKWCEKNPAVKYWNSEETVIPYRSAVDGRIHRYFVDLTIWFDDGTVFIVEIKPAAQTKPPKKPARKTKRYISEALTYAVNESKWEAAKYYAEQKGWHFVKWTEVELEKMGMKSMTSKKAFKPLKPLKRKKTVKKK